MHTGNQKFDKRDTISSSIKISAPTEASSEFGILLLKIISELEKNKKHNLAFIKDLCNHLSPKDDPTASLFSADQLRAINDCSDIRTLLKEISGLWRWDDFSLLEAIVQNVGNSDCKSLVSQYKQNLDYNMKLHMIYEHCKQEKSHLPEGCTAMFAIVEKNYIEITLKEYTELKKFTSQRCGVEPMFMFPFARAMPHFSVLFEWFVPLAAASYMIRVATSNSHMFTQRGFVCLQIDLTKIFDNRSDTYSVSLYETLVTQYAKILHIIYYDWMDCAITNYVCLQYAINL